MSAWLRRCVFGISSDQVSAARRGFRGGEYGAPPELERAGQVFLYGYHAALEDTEASSLALRLNNIDGGYRGFAFEGAAMALALLDFLTPWPGSRWRAFAYGPAQPHFYTVHVGAGWALARVPRRIAPILARFDPVLAWLLLDGYGFHEGFFSWQHYFAGRAYPRRVTGYARRAFDQGFGRSMWFIDGANVERIPETISLFSPERRADLWSGVGLAVAYAGCAGHEDLEFLWRVAGDYRANIAQGAAFAAKARLRAGNLAAHTDLASKVLCGVSAEAAARVTDEALEGLGVHSESQPAYELWRRRIQARFASVTIGG